MLILRDIRPSERRGALAAFYTVGGIMAGHELLETARDALFLASVPASRLPWVYLVVAVLGMAIARGPMGRLGRLFGTYALSALIVGSAILTAALWLVADPRASWSLYVTYVWSALFATLVILQFWNVLGRVYTSTDAKRVFHFIGLGAIAGAIGGALVANVLAAILPAEHLLLAAGGTLLLAAPGALFLAATPPLPDRRPLPDLRECVHCVVDQRYTRRLAWMILFATLSVTLIDYVFKSLVAAHVPSAELGSFFALLNLALDVGSLLAQLVLSRWLLRHFGLHKTLAVLPLLVLLGAIGVALGGALVAVLILKGVDGSLRHSVHRTATELLYVPLTHHVRAAAKELTDVVIQRGGQAVASLAILVGVGTLGVPDEVLAAVAAMCAAGWLLLALTLRQPYLDLFRATLADGQLRMRVDFPTIDIGSLESLIGTLNSRDDDEVIASMDVLAAQGKAALIPDLFLHHSSERVVLRALELFPEAKGATVAPALDRLIEGGEPAVRAAAIRARMAIDGAPGWLDRLAEDPSPEVRAVALVGLANAGTRDSAPWTRLLELASQGSPVERRAAARTIADQPSDSMLEVLFSLSQSRDVDTRASVCRALGALADARGAPALIAMLEQRAVREAARRALVAIGGDALGMLEKVLEDAAWDPAVKRHVPRTISRFDPARAASVMLQHLARSPDGVVGFELLRGLGRLRADHPDIEMDARVLEVVLVDTVRRAFQLLHVRSVLEEAMAEGTVPGGTTTSLLVSLLIDEERHAIERVFRVLGLLVPDADVESIHRGLRSADARTQSSSRELIAAIPLGRLRPLRSRSALAHAPVLGALARAPIAPADVRNALLALVDDAPAVERLLRATPLYVAAPVEATDVMDEMLGDSSEALASVARHHRAELARDGHHEL